MAYGITDESQIIDTATITRGINKFREAIEAFELSGKKVIQASEICTADALSIDNNTLQWPIEDLGIEIKDLKVYLNSLADEVLYEAQVVSSQQYNELTEYRRQQALLAQQQAQQQAQQGQNNP